LRIWVRPKDEPWKKLYISEEDFDPDNMTKFTEDELNEEKKLGSVRIKDMVESKQAFGFGGLDNKEAGESMYYKGQLNEDATSEFLDKNLDYAKKRAKERNDKTGSSFRKMKRLSKRRKH